MSLFIFIGIIFLGFLFSIWFLIWGGGDWDSGRRFNIILNTMPLRLISFDKDEKSMVVVSIPPDSYLHISENYGEYKAESIFPLGELDPKLGGGMLLMDTIKNTFGLPIDGYIDFSDKDLNGNIFTPSRLWEINNNRLTGKAKVKTNLKLATINRFFIAAMNLRSDQVKNYDLTKLDIVEDFALPDKTKIQRIDSNKLDKILEGLFAENDIINEKISISVYNASRTAGMATSVARTITNIGGRVIFVGNVEGKIKEKCKINGNDKGTKTYKRLKNIFKCIEDKKQQVGKLSDINLYIGQDYNP